VNGPQT